MGCLIAAPDPVAQKLSELYIQWWATPDAQNLRQTIINHLQPSSGVDLISAKLHTVVCKGRVDTPKASLFKLSTLSETAPYDPLLASEIVW